MVKRRVAAVSVGRGMPRARREIGSPDDSEASQRLRVDAILYTHGLHHLRQPLTPQPRREARKPGLAGSGKEKTDLSSSSRTRASQVAACFAVESVGPWCGYWARYRRNQSRTRTRIREAAGSAAESIKAQPWR